MEVRDEPAAAIRRRASGCSSARSASPTRSRRRRATSSRGCPCGRSIHPRAGSPATGGCATWCTRSRRSASPPTAPARPTTARASASLELERDFRCFTSSQVHGGGALALSPDGWAIGIVPDGIDRVTLTARGETTTAEVVENVYEARLAGPGRRAMSASRRRALRRGCTATLAVAPELLERVAVLRPPRRGGPPAAARGARRRARVGVAARRDLHRRRALLGRRGRGRVLGRAGRPARGEGLRAGDGRLHRRGDVGGARGRPLRLGQGRPAGRHLEDRAAVLRSRGRVRHRARRRDRRAGDDRDPGTRRSTRGTTSSAAWSRSRIATAPTPAST